jgi:hypothetical protein
MRVTRNLSVTGEPETSLQDELADAFRAARSEQFFCCI